MNKLKLPKKISRKKDKGNTRCYSCNGTGFWPNKSVPVCPQCQGTGKCIYKLGIIGKKGKFLHGFN